MSDQTYDDGRRRNLEALLRTLGERIRALDAEGKLLAHPGELMKLLGEVRSELFHYEVRATYDTPEVAESRRIVEQAKDQQDNTDTQWQRNEWKPDEEDEKKGW